MIVSGITIISKNEEDKKIIINQLFNLLLKMDKSRSKRIHKPIKKDGEELPGYDAYHARGELNYNEELISTVKTSDYFRQIKKILSEEEKEQIGDYINSEDEIVIEEFIPVVEIIFQTEEEYERANTIAAHHLYKEMNGAENIIDIQQRYKRNQLHRFWDIPLMFEWKFGQSNLKLLSKNDTIKKMYPYLFNNDNEETKGVKNRE